MKASEIMVRYKQLEDMASRDDELEFELNDIAPDVDQIEQHGEQVYDAASEAFGDGFAMEALQNGAYVGAYTSIGEFLQDNLLDCLGLGDVNVNWIDFDAIATDLQMGGDYIFVENGNRGIFVFNGNY